MATVPLVEEDEAPESVRVVYERIKQGFGDGHVPNAYKAFAHHPEVLAALVDYRGRVMGHGSLEPEQKEWLAWAAVTLANNQFGIKVHTARLKRMGVTNAQLLEALAVLHYFTGISVMINGLALGQDIDQVVETTLRDLGRL
jgi:alkylhydroperoxidase/carboxymuconolactone decarboxylase family protein YurZ